MKEYTLNIQIDKPFGNLYRKRHILIICKDIQGNFVLGAKPNFYPKNIVRLLGGGVKDGESELDAGVREIKEELSISVDKTNLVPLASIKVTATNSESEYSMTTYLYFLQLKDDSAKAGDDVEGLAKLTREEYEKLIQVYYNLSQDNWYEGEEGHYSWHDYGQVYGPIHKIALEEVAARQL